MAIELTRERVMKAALEVYEEVPVTFSYRDVVTGWEPGIEACRYTIGGEPACIVGVILNKCGISIAHGNMLAVGPLLEMMVNDGDITIGTGVAYELQHAQREQDAGATWHDALTGSGLVIA